MITLTVFNASLEIKSATLTKNSVGASPSPGELIALALMGNKPHTLTISAVIPQLNNMVYYTNIYITEQQSLTEDLEALAVELLKAKIPTAIP